MEITQLLMVVAASVVGPFLAGWIRLPAATVLILLGIVLGPSGLKQVEPNKVFAFASEMGFLILMFIAGMEIDFDSIREAGKRALIPSIAASLGFFAVAAIATAVFHLPAVQLLVVSASSVGMPLAVLKETKTLRTPLGREVLLTASVGEFFTILGITGYQVALRVGFGWHFALEMARLIGLIVGSAYVIRWARALVWWYPDTLEKTAKEQHSSEMGVRVGLLIMLGFVLVSRLFQVEAILGAFIAGTLVSFVLREKHALEEKINALGQGLFIPFFFFSVGVKFKPGQLDKNAVLLTAGLLLIVAVVKIVPVLFLGSRALSTRQRLSAGVLLSAPLTLVVAIASVGYQLHAITDRENAAVLLLAIVLSVVFPTIFRALVARAAPVSKT